MQACVDELTRSGWPDVIHHTDLHPGNAIVDASGRLRILDWDQAAVGFPCDSVMWLEVFEDQEPWCQDGGSDTVKTAYLNTVPWGSPDLRSRVWSTAARIGHITSAYQSDRQNLALERTEARGDNIIRLMTGLLQTMESTPR